MTKHIHPLGAPALAALIDSGLALDAVQLARRLQAVSPDVARALVCLEGKGWVTPTSDCAYPLSRAYRFRAEAGLVVDSPCGRRWFLPATEVAAHCGGKPSRVSWSDIDRAGLLLRQASPEQVEQALDALRAAAGVRPGQSLMR